MSTNFKQTKEFERDLKKLGKKYPSLKKDLEKFKKFMFLGDVMANKNFSVLTKENGVEIIKARLFCRSLKRNSLRIVYAYYEESGDVEFIGVEFIELYFKGDKVREDWEGIKIYLKNV
ncbi:MAG: hypothetical protein ABII02_02435 [Candidatus Magasanikbacteria bacterium]